MDSSGFVLLHGFTQTGASWDRVRSVLEADGASVDSPDLPGHGSADEQRTGLRETAERLAATYERRVWVGYSMGARVALHVALTHPEVVDGLVLLSGTAGIDDPDERAVRRREDEMRAEALERDGVAPFLDVWLAQPMFATLPPDAAERARRLENSAAGLASSLRLSGTGTMEPPLWDRLGAIEAPTLIVAGALDEKFTRLGRRLAEGIGANASFRSIDGVAHAAHFEQPEVFCDIVSRWRRRSA